jgi:hypothetical protein
MQYKDMYVCSLLTKPIYNPKAVWVWNYVFSVKEHVIMLLMALDLLLPFTWQLCKQCVAHVDLLCDEVNFYRVHLITKHNGIGIYNYWGVMRLTNSINALGNIMCVIFHVWTNVHCEATSMLITGLYTFPSLSPVFTYLTNSYTSAWRKGIWMSGQGLVLHFHLRPYTIILLHIVKTRLNCHKIAPISVQFLKRRIQLAPLAIR